jgi:hypothetical protein
LFPDGDEWGKIPGTNHQRNFKLQPPKGGHPASASERLHPANGSLTIVDQIINKSKS